MSSNILKDYVVNKAVVGIAAHKATALPQLLTNNELVVVNLYPVDIHPQKLILSVWLISAVLGWKPL